MKVYFIFDIKDEFVKLYQDNERVLFNILKQIYFLDKEELSYAYTLLNQLIKTIDKSTLDRKIFLQFHQDIPYSKRGQTHYINNLYKDEISRLEIKKSHIRLECEQSFSSFLPILRSFSENYFICDFQKQDFFFINKEESIPKINIQTYTI